MPIMSSGNEPTDEDRAVDTDDDATDQAAGDEVDQDDEQEILIDNVLAEGEDDPEPDGGDQ